MWGLFPMSQGSFNTKIRFLGQKGMLCSPRTDTHMKVNTEDTLSGLQEPFFKPIIKDRSKNTCLKQGMGYTHKL